jgi:hypothetical protein
MSGNATAKLIKLAADNKKEINYWKVYKSVILCNSLVPKQKYAEKQ